MIPSTRLPSSTSSVWPARTGSPYPLAIRTAKPSSAARGSMPAATSAQYGSRIVGTRSPIVRDIPVTSVLRRVVGPIAEAGGRVLHSLSGRRQDAGVALQGAGDRGR